MNVPYDTIKAAQELIKADGNEKLFCSLAEWFRHKGELALNEQNLTFWRWVEVRLDDLAWQIGKDKLPSECKAADLVEALRVNAMGVALAKECEAGAEKKGFKSDINCYVEDGMVYVSVYVGGKTSEEGWKEAEAIAAKFIEKGYATDVYHDDEDETEVFMAAVIDFPIYLKVK